MRHGFLLVRKPTGPTSHDVVSRVRKILSEQDIGHLGTLDPAASGLLVLAVGSKALKVIEFFNDLPKQYEADIRLGSVSSTYDSEGVIEAVTPRPGWNAPDIMSLRRMLEDRFVGIIEQVPPAHSAVHIAGKRAYELARAGKLVQPPPRKVDISECCILSYEFPSVHLRVSCGSGTYIRSLAHDLGQMLRCGGYLQGLKRTKVGSWDIEQAVPLDDVAWTFVLPLKEVLLPLRRIDVTEADGAELRFGRNIPHEVKPGTFAWCQGMPIAILDPAKDGTRKAHPRKVL